MKKVTYLVLVLLCIMMIACGTEVEPVSVTQSSVIKHETPFAVGSTTRFIHDGSRPYDSVAGINTGVRTLITEIWYPVDHQDVAKGQTNYRQATYGDYVFGNKAVHHLMMTETTFFHLIPATVREDVSQEQIDAAIDELFYRPRNSFVNAPLAQGDQPWPVLVMSHGDAGSRYNMETACEFLAGHGYVVIAPEHTGNSPYSMTGNDPALSDSEGNAEFRSKMADVLAVLGEHGTYGKREKFGQSYTPLSQNEDPIQALRDLDNSLLQRLNDLRATLAGLDRMNGNGLFAGRLDLERIGLFGRSYGGVTTIMGLSMEPRFTAGFSVVPPGFPDPRAALPPQVLVEQGTESVMLSADGAFPLTEIKKPMLLLSGAEDGLLIGISKAMANSYGTTLPTRENPHPLIREAYEASSAPVVWGLLADASHSALGVSGGFWWPELKSDTQKRTFEPEVEFELVSPKIAHKIQRELALDFFDLTIKQIPSARERLLDQRFADDGLKLEARNY